METARRFLRGPNGSFFLFGPRGAGKSTWLQATLPEAPRVDLLDPESQRVYQARPERLRELVALGKDRLEIDGIAITPCEVFLRRLRSGQSSIDE